MDDENGNRVDINQTPRSAAAPRRAATGAPRRVATAAPNQASAPHRVSTAPSRRPTEADLAAAFSDDAPELARAERVSRDGVSNSDSSAPENDPPRPNDSQSSEKKHKKTKKPLTKLRKISIGVLVVGAVALIAGIGFLVYNILNTPSASDADYLVQVKTWQREDAPSVIWKFTEIGKGQLTTNDGENTYDFTWAFDDGKLKIDTDWLYTLNDEYEFSIDQHDQKLTLKDGENGDLVFIPSDKALGTGTPEESVDENS